MPIKTENGEPIMHVISDDEKKQFETLKKIFVHTNPEKFEGVYFICGEAGEKDDMGLPEYIHVCPAYGADFRATTMYKKVEKN
jgi:hypothetical protein